MDSDQVNNPAHYSKGIEVIEIIESWDLDFCLGNTLKYVLRSPFKGNPLLDLQKAHWYAHRYLMRRINEDLFQRVSRFLSKSTRGVAVEAVRLSWGLDPQTADVVAQIRAASESYSIGRAYALKRGLEGLLDKNRSLS